MSAQNFMQIFREDVETFEEMWKPELLVNKIKSGDHQGLEELSTTTGNYKCLYMKIFQSICETC